MTTKIKKEEEKVTEEKQEEKFKASDYSCEILLERTTSDKANNKKFPTDAYNVTYSVDGKDFLDVTRSYKMSNIFDMYHDRYGNVKSIDYGQGSISPNRWGYKEPPRKKRRKG
tara:strand:- start:203 stop:541 length:339 start_codon:yes stop_codon:yes gene_type:complete